MAMATTAQLLLAPEAARELGVSVREVYALIDRGELEAVLQPVDERTGRWVHVRRADVETLRRAHR